MIPNMEPPIVSSDAARMSFDEADPKAMLTLDLLKEMYVGREFPFLVSSRDGFSHLIVPRTVQRKSWEGSDAESVTDKETSLHGVSDRAGTSNG